FRRVLFRSGHGPAGGGAVPDRAPHLLAEFDEATEPVLLGAGEDVALDLVPRRVALGPIRLALEGIRVEVRLDVAGATRIGVVAPGPAHLVGLLEDDEIGAPRFEELDAHAEPAEAGSDDQYVDVPPPSIRSDLRVHGRSPFPGSHPVI